jgi:hypothetical protein
MASSDASKVVVDYEFGGPWGVSALMIGFPILMSYLYICLATNHGHLENPLHWDFWMDGIRQKHGGLASDVYLLLLLY